MDKREKNEKIDYLEFQVEEIEKEKEFFENVFSWKFTDYGNDYSAFADAGIDGGIVRSKKRARSDEGSVLIVFYSIELEKTRDKIADNGGKIIKPIFTFPGGRRFHFTSPGGNEFAVWSDR